MANRSGCPLYTHENQEDSVPPIGKSSEDLSHLACGEFYLSWYINSDKHLEPVGNDLEAALNALQLKRLEMAFAAAGGQVKQPDLKKELEVRLSFAAVTIKKTDDVADRNSDRESSCPMRSMHI